MAEHREKWFFIGGVSAGALGLLLFQRLQKKAGFVKELEQAIQAYAEKRKLKEDDKDLIPCRDMLSLFEQRRTFYIFGHPVALSASPTMQTVGFKINGKPYSYERYDTPSIEDVAWKLSLVSTGGGSVTIPHKESLMQYMDSVSEAAREIGAVNTVTKEPGSNRLLGDNTDWIGIKQQLLPKVRHRSGDKVGLIIGAGGTARAAAYAFRSMGLKKIYILNRTFEKALAISTEFGDMFEPIKDAEALSSLDRLDAVMGTLPGQAAFELPPGILDKHKPAVIEAAYRSSESGHRFTALLQQAVNAGCETIEGIEMLFEQGCAQCEIWTGKNAPRKQIAQGLLSYRFAKDPNPPKNLVYEASLES
jgi:pentafunctional AROM polypeptide